jgi:putative toxin-antitoxin system antitoxin component (TIGR02293 family)
MRPSFMQTVEAILDLPGAASPLALVDRINDGLPLAAVDAFAVRAGLEPALRYRLIPKATLATRRKRHEPLSREESARLARGAKILALAEAVWGSLEEARAFLHRAHPMLEDRRPIDVTLDNEFGAELVEGILQRLRFGSAA